MIPRQDKPKAFISRAYDLTEDERKNFEKRNIRRGFSTLDRDTNGVGLPQDEYLEAAKILFENIGYASLTMSNNKTEELAQEQLKATIDGDGVTEYMASQAREISKEKRKKEDKDESCSSTRKL